MRDYLLKYNILCERSLPKKKYIYIYPFIPVLKYFLIISRNITNRITWRIYILQKKYQISEPINSKIYLNILLFYKRIDGKLNEKVKWKINFDTVT